MVLQNLKLLPEFMNRDTVEPMRHTGLCIYTPTLEDVIDPTTTHAVRGQVVRISRVIGEGTEVVEITTPDGTLDLGYVVIESLRPLSRRRKLNFDPTTGHTAESKLRIC
jgi:hypothetical protein